MISTVLNSLLQDALLGIMVLNLIKNFSSIGKAFSIESFLTDDSMNARSSSEPTFEVFCFFCLNMKKLLVLSLLDTSSVIRLCPPPSRSSGLDNNQKQLNH